MTTDRKDAPVTEAGREPTLDELWAVVSESMAIADEHRLAIYRSGDGVPGPEALEGIQKHIDAGLAARVMYERLREAEAATAARSDEIDELAEAIDAHMHAEYETYERHQCMGVSCAADIAARLRSEQGERTPRVDPEIDAT